VEIISHGQTDVGRKRDHNEDSFLVSPERGLYIVADGMGGHAAGEVASSTAVQVIFDELNKHQELVQSYRYDGPYEIREQILRLTEETVLKACAEIYAKGQDDKRRRGMGTTLSLMLVTNSGAFIAHVGDSRIYLVREGQVHQLTVDHSLVNEQLRRGTISKDEARKAKYKNVITRALGIQERVRVDTMHIDVLPGDQFLLCSDGLHGYLRTGDVERILTAGPPEVVPQEFIDLANDRGGKDNISVVYLLVGEDEKEAATELRQRMDFMRKAPLFRYLSYRELVNLMNLTYMRTARDGEVIIEENVTGDEMFLLVQGEVKVSKGEQEIARLPQGSNFGEMALIDNAPRSASIHAIGPVRLLVIGRKQFYEFIRKDPPSGIKLLWSFLQILTSRLRSTDEQLLKAREELCIQEVEPDWILTED
jgi:PPM family protein phosphatase